MGKLRNANRRRQRALRLKPLDLLQAIERKLDAEAKERERARGPRDQLRALIKGRKLTPRQEAAACVYRHLHYGALASKISGFDITPVSGASSEPTYISQRRCLRQLRVLEREVPPWMRKITRFVVLENVRPSRLAELWGFSEPAIVQGLKTELDAIAATSVAKALVTGQREKIAA